MRFIHPSIYSFNTKTNASNIFFLPSYLWKILINIAVGTKMCKIRVFTDIWLLILTPDSSLFSTPANHLKNNAHHTVYSIQLVPETRCRPCICFCTVWWDLLPHAVSSPCAVFLEDRKGVINESCVLITANSLRGTFKGLRRGWRETEPHCSPCGNYKLGLHGSYSFFFLRRVTVKDSSVNNSVRSASAVGGSSSHWTPTSDVELFKFKQTLLCFGQ